MTSTEAAHAKVRNTHAALAGAGRVLLLGAGPVGIELAGEIKAVWPGKQVTLVDVAGDVLGERYRPDLKAELRRQLTDLGAGLLLGSPLRAGPPTAPGEPGTFTVTTQAGDEVTADIWFRCYGVTPASDYLAGGLAAARRPDGFVEVTPELRVAGQDRVFALGRRVGRGPEQGGGRGRPPGARRGRQHPRAHHRRGRAGAVPAAGRPASSCRSGPTAAPGSGQAARIWCRPRRWPSSRAGT